MEHPVTVIYIISDRRSGSTLLENMLSKSDETVSVGELAMLKGHIVKQGPGEIWNWNCSCGNPVLQCLFWSKVLGTINENDFETKINWPYKSSKALWAALFPSIFKNNLNKFACNKKNTLTTSQLEAVYLSLSKVSGKKFIIDSSKDPVQALAVHKCKNIHVKIIWLSRDLRAITFSKLKRWKVNKRSDKKPLETLTDSFYYKRICQAAVKIVGAENCLKINYEPLAVNPQKELVAICSSFGIENYAAPEFMELSNDHTIAGTPGRFERKKIQADDSWKEFYKQHKLLNVLGKIFNVM